MYGWKIDRDYFDGEATGVSGPRGGMVVPDGEGETFALWMITALVCGAAPVSSTTANGSSFVAPISAPPSWRGPFFMPPGDNS